MASLTAELFSAPEVHARVSDPVADDELLLRCKAGQAAAWSALVRRYQRLIYTIAVRAGLGEDAAADVFQVTFTRLFENLGRIKDASRVRAWLVTTAKRETLSLLHHQRQHGSAAPAAHDDEAENDVLSEWPDPSPLAETQLADLQELARLRLAVERLDPRSRQFVELAFLHDEPLSYADLAARLGVAENSVGPTKARCLEKLRRLLLEI